LLLRFLNRKNARATVAIASTPRLAPRPAARPVLVLLDWVAATPVGEEAPEAWLAALLLVLVVDVVIVLDMVLAVVLEDSTEVEVAVDASMF
jgi:hypothetical protein